MIRDPRPRILIIGAGITGLAAAYRLVNNAREGGRAIDVTLLESSSRLGGKIVTEKERNFTIEGGPDIMLARKPRGIGLCGELGIGGRIIPTNASYRRSFIRIDGELLPLPEGLSGLIPTRLRPLFQSRVLSFRGKCRVGFDRFIPPLQTDDDESVAAFITRRLGREAYEKLVAPLLGGIYGGRGERLSLIATFPQLHDIERRHGSLIRGLVSEARSPGRPVGAPAFVSLAGGMAELITTLRERIPDVLVKLNSPVRIIERTTEGYRILAGDEVLEADAVVLAAPAHAAWPLVSSLDASLSAELSRISYASCATLSLAFRRSQVVHPLDAYGYLTQGSGGGGIIACTWTSTKIPLRAPTDGVLLRLFFGQAEGFDATEQDDEVLMEMARSELRDTLGLTQRPLLHRVFRWKKAMPQYELGHSARLARIDARLAHHPGLFVAGAAYHGVGIPDCIADGERAADKAFRLLHQSACRALS